MVRFTGKISLVHHAVPVEHYAIHGADFMRQDRQFITDADALQFHIHQRGPFLAMRNAWHASRECVQNGGSSRGGVTLQRLAARQHQHHDRRHKIFSQQQCRKDGYACQQVGSKFALHKFARKSPHQRHTTINNATSNGVLECREGK